MSGQVRKTDASGQRLNEAKHINKSLSALGNVIGALTQGEIAGAGQSQSQSEYGAEPGLTLPQQSSKRHIPYRDSKLTRILQESISGNSKTTLILTVASNKNSTSETIATLRFGERARKLTTKPRLNLLDGRDPSGKELESELARLRSTLLEAQQEIIRLSEIIADSAEMGMSGSSGLCSKCTGGGNTSADSFEVLGAERAEGISQYKGECFNSDIVFGQLSIYYFVKLMVHVIRIDAVSDEFGAVRVWDGGCDSHGHSRCAVCGLTDHEGNSLDDSLFISTGTTNAVSSSLNDGRINKEGMGEMFTCDGNCGEFPFASFSFSSW